MGLRSIIFGMLVPLFSASWSSAVDSNKVILPALGSYHVSAADGNLYLHSEQNGERTTLKLRLDEDSELPRDVIAVMLAPWCQSSPSNLFAVTTGKLPTGEHIYHAVFLDRDRTNHFTGSAFTLEVYRSAERLNLLGVNGSFKSDSVVIFFGEFEE